MKTFDFNHPDFKKHFPDHQEYLLKNHDKPITEAEFIEWWTKRPRQHPDGSPILHASNKRNPSYARRKYKRLVSVYGLFPQADDPVSDLVVKSREPSKSPANPPSDPKRKANT